LKRKASGSGLPRDSNNSALRQRGHAPDGGKIPKKKTRCFPKKVAISRKGKWAMANNMGLSPWGEGGSTKCTAFAKETKGPQRAWKKKRLRLEKRPLIWKRKKTGRLPGTFVPTSGRKGNFLQTRGRKRPSQLEKKRGRCSERLQKEGDFFSQLREKKRTEAVNGGKNRGLTNLWTLPVRFAECRQGRKTWPGRRRERTVPIQKFLFLKNQRPATLLDDQFSEQKRRDKKP